MSIRIIREDGTDYLFAGFLERELAKHQTTIKSEISIEPRRGEIHFCQDYSFDNNPPPKFVFYALPSWRKDHLEKMGKNCAIVSYAADPQFHKPTATNKEYDVGFVGRRYYPDRGGYLEVLTSRFKTLFYDNLPSQNTATELSRCKVLFNHTRPEIDVNLRFFESMALGCQVMLRTPALDEFAKEGVHYLGYSTTEECVSQIQKLLDDDDLRNKITINSRSHFLANHTYAHRAQAIINHLTEFYENNM